jgi:hypothetical protein
MSIVSLKSGLALFTSYFGTSFMFSGYLDYPAKLVLYYFPADNLNYI